MEYIKNCFKGMVIGAAAIMPGVSSGVICVLLGIYEKLLERVLNIFKDLKSNLKFLIPLGVGGLIGIVMFGKMLNYLFYEYPYQTNFTFIGLILGSLPILLKQTNQKEKFKLRYILYFIIAFIIGIIMVFMEQVLPISSNTEFSYGYLIMARYVYVYWSYYSRSK